MTYAAFNNGSWEIRQEGRQDHTAWFRILLHNLLLPLLFESQFLYLL